MSCHRPENSEADDDNGQGCKIDPIKQSHFLDRCPVFQHISLIHRSTIRLLTPNSITNNKGLLDTYCHWAWTYTNRKQAPMDDEQHLPSGEGQPSGHRSHQILVRRVAQRPANHRLLMVGVLAEVYLVDNKIIRKMPCSESQEDRLPIAQEARVYSILGVHPRIAEWVSRGRLDYVDVKYYPHGDLASYCQRNFIDADLQATWFLQILEAVVFVHSRHVIHSDLALRQFFVDNDLNLRLGDFNASQYPGHAALGYEKASHCLPRDYEMPNTEASDIFALGSTLYELVAGRAPYSELAGAKSDDPDVIKAQIQRQHPDDYEIESRYKNGIFPDISGLYGGDVILGCWRGDFAHAKEALDLYLNEY